MMKFAPLALVFLWAAGCQAEFDQTDNPSKYEQIRAAVVTFLTKTKELAQNIVTDLDDAEFNDFKVLFNKDLETIEAYIKSVAEYFALVRKRVGPRIGDLISAGLENFSYDPDKMCKELDPKSAELLEVLRKLFEDFSEFIDPVLQKIEYIVHHNLAILFKELRESPIVNGITIDLFNLVRILDSSYRYDLWRNLRNIDHTIGSLLDKCKWLQPWKLPWV